MSWTRRPWHDWGSRRPRCGQYSSSSVTRLLRNSLGCLNTLASAMIKVCGNTDTGTGVTGVNVGYQLRDLLIQVQ